MELKAIVQSAEAMAREVGVRIREQIFSTDRNFKVEFKGNVDLVTEVDLWSERTIQNRIREAYPSHVMIGEESAQTLQQELGRTLLQIAQESCCWIIDPIDGTTNFANGLPQVSVSLGFVDHGVVSAGVVYDVARDEMFTATLGGGAWCNGQRLVASRKEKLIDAVVATGLPYDRAKKWPLYDGAFRSFVESARTLRILGSAAIDQAWVAAGRLDGFFEYGLKSWDVAAGSLLVQEAGGRAGNFSTLNESKSFSIFSDSFVFSGNQLFDEMIERARTADRLARRSSQEL